MPYRPPIHRPQGSRAERRALAAPRLSPSKRGYDRLWEKARLVQLAREPLCRFCAEQGRVTAADCVDHILPLASRPDLRLVPANLRSLCTPCHNAHTARETARARGPA